MQFPPPVAAVLPGDLVHNFPVISLVFANIVTILLAIIEQWDLATVMFIYLAQSIIIGIFTVISLVTVNTAALAEDLEKPVRERGGTARVTTRFAFFFQCLLAGFFALHYGLFHWGYYSFIVDSGLFGAVNFSDTGLWLSCTFFFINHLYSYLPFRSSQPKGSEYLNELFFSPYRRIIPMHMTIIFGSIVILVLSVIGISSTLPVLVLFLLLKTWTDIRGHLLKHYQEEHPGAPVQYL